MTAFLTFSGALQSSSYQTHFRYSAIRLLKTHLPLKSRSALTACYHNISSNNLAETVLVMYLPTAHHNAQQRTSLQQELLRAIGHGSPATPSLPVRNVTLDFFEAIMSTPTNLALTSHYHLQLQQASGHYHYYSAVKPFVPFQPTLSSMYSPEVDITGAVIIERHFDSICKCSAIQAGTTIPYSALALRTSHPTSLIPPQSIPQMRPFVAPTGPRPLTWYAQSLPFMNKTCWPRLYALQQLQSTKDPITRPQLHLSTKISLMSV